jgi:hypothetical protein
MSWLGRLFGRESTHREGDVLPASAATTPELEAIAMARRAAEEGGHPWLMPVRAELIWHAERPCWFVSTNAHSRGHRVTVVVDDSVGHVVRIDEQPR